MAIRNAQERLANLLQVGDMDRVADFGCGVGGPLRGLVRRTGANVTGITINAHQVCSVPFLCMSHGFFNGVCMVWSWLRERGGGGGGGGGGGPLLLISCCV